MNQAARVARDVRRARGRARRERQSLGDALYVIYVTVLFTSYPLAILGSRAAPRPGFVRSAVAQVEPLLLLAVGLAVLVGRAAAAVQGGPVVLPPEDARLLVTWPVPRRALVLPALAAALSRALAAGLLMSAVLLYVDVRDLGAPAVAVLRDDVVLPGLLAVLVVLVGWLVQVSPALGSVVRVIGAVLGLGALVAFCWTARQIALVGFAPALVRVADVGPSAADLPLSGAATATAPAHGWLAALILIGVLAALTVLSVRAAARATPEQLLSRSRRADVTRTGLKLGFTSSVYLSRTEPVRRARRRRITLPRGRSPVTALLGKAFVQEQGTPVAARVLACAAVTGSVLAAASRVTPGRSLAATVVWAGLAGIALTLVATRFADPVRLDVDRAALAGAMPLRHAVLARIDIATSAALAFLGAVVGTTGAAALGLVRWHRLPELLIAGVAVGLLLAAAGALGALSNDPSPFLPPALAIGYRTSGFAAVMLGCVAAALELRHSGAASATGQQDRLPGAALVLALTAVVALALATGRAAGALRRGR